MSDSPFVEFPKIPRLNREVVVTEKLDGTNACVVVTEGEGGEFNTRIVTAQSRSRIITPQNDNFGFAAWVEANAAVLRQLGPGHHFGEWWGAGIQRRYGLSEKRFSLFNVHRWGETRPACCHVVPVICRGIGFGCVAESLSILQSQGSIAAPGFDKPEGVIAFHAASNHLFKATIERDEEHKRAVLGCAP